MLRFLLTTDIHSGFNQGNKKGVHAPRLVARTIRIANKENVDFYADLGDRIICKNADSDRFHLERLSQTFNTLAVPYEGIDGNHCIANLSPEENARILGQPVHSRSRDVNGIHVVFWSPEYILEFSKSLNVSDADLEWLHTDLAGTHLPSIILNHVPLDNNAEDDARMKKFIPAFYTNGTEIRKIIEDSGKVILSIAGHRHRNRHSEINGTHYITHQSLTQRNENTGHPRGAFSLFEIDGNQIRAKGYGVGQPSYTLPILSGP